MTMSFKLFPLMCLLLLVFSRLTAQNLKPMISLDFNECQIQDQGVQQALLQVGGLPECVCGPEEDAVRFDGMDNYIHFEDKLNALFSKDFTISFYVKIENTSGVVDILSYHKTCVRDSSFTLKYLPQIKQFRFDMVKNLSRSTQMLFQLDETSCWQHIVITRKGFDYTIFLNNRQVAQTRAETDYIYSPVGTFAISNSPCLGISDVRLRGDIENFQIFDKSFIELEVKSLDLHADQILNRDTTLLLGDELQIAMGPSCKDAFWWDNTTDLNNANLFEPVIRPEKTTMYSIFMRNGACVAKDSITIYIQDPTKVDCRQLLLPNAFSPNGDKINDHFEISNKYIVEDIMSFNIFNRQGARVFSGTDKHSTWDGFYQGSKLNPEKFAYVIEYTCQGEQYTKQGTVSLIR